ncbi:hypothetical protein CH363_02260 [Leptospira haakeii]|uniref:Uncharacterized protein n=1 Tax=Leptospira haakeii TaxID=2023198 RepID=A0ABX4PQC3_9LEPT|nr:hypothetical protein CH363_02260 [Leptospira haakeii]PKA21215.1 hypothetical protein CH377_02260 [Leptospira haakeii]
MLLASVETVVLFRLRRKNRERYFQKVQEKFVIIRIFFSDKNIDQEGLYIERMLGCCILEDDNKKPGGLFRDTGSIKGKIR